MIDSLIDWFFKRSKQEPVTMARLVPGEDKGSVYIFFDITTPEQPTPDPIAHQVLLELSQRYSGLASTSALEKEEEEKKRVGAPQEGFVNRMTVQVLVDGKDVCRLNNKHTGMSEEAVEKRRKGLKEVTVARVSVMSWVFHICRAVEAMMKGRTRNDWDRRRHG